MKKMTISKAAKNNTVTYGMVIVAFIIVQVLLVTGHVSSLMKGLLVPLCVYIIMAVSLDLAVGIPGKLSPSHTGFMCVGAFASSFFSVCMKGTMINTGLRFLPALLIGAITAAVAGIIVGIPILRLRGNYLAIVTLAFGEIIRNVVNVICLGRNSAGFHVPMKNSMGLNMLENSKVVIGGAQDIVGTPNNPVFVIGFVLILITLFIVLSLTHSRSDWAIMAIRGNWIAAESISINIIKHKLMAFTVSTSLAGVADVLYSHNLSTLTATQKNFGCNQSIMILVFVVLGSIDNIRGSVITAVILTLLPELLRGLNSYRVLICAIVLVAMMVFSWSPAVINFRRRHSFRQTLGRRKTTKGVQ